MSFFIFNSFNIFLRNFIIKNVYYQYMIFFFDNYCYLF
ncbi:hypothetical protein BHWA1_01027 [Brachyspira hyodysenteriae WA1]|uniref:Uncharacterized protein n=1 Tax=Brachyspira hyodysenteriae (strain ATCC 49526 / WA1) TaxID=565034 RepID=A0A3B6VA66_BRAHW|nr:hypothetical protein BHWA1_01027 [Brachyspira hyodysenteriae WA1]